MPRQVLQELRSGRTRIAQVPMPQCPPGHILVATRRSILSAGTERMLIEFGRGSLLQKARSQPERVRQVLAKIRTDGLMPTLSAVREKLEQPIPLGYCNAGVVIAAGDAQSAARFPKGTRVASNGPHAEFALAGVNVAARIPDNVSDEAAAFAPLAAIALQGVRLAQPTLGETVFVMGCGLVGLLAVQLAIANGCRVIASDLHEDRLALAKAFGAHPLNARDIDPVEAARVYTRGTGVDAVIIAASAASTEPARQAAEMCRVRGRIVLVGVVGLEFDRRPFYDKEITFQVSCSYGVGRYDSAYESGKVEMPIGHVRWTEQRNFEAVLELMSAGRLDPLPLISHRFPIAEAECAYAAIMEDERSLGVVLEYDADSTHDAYIRPTSSGAKATGTKIGLIGSGEFARRQIMPWCKANGVTIDAVSSQRGATAAAAAQRFGISRVVGTAEEILDDASIGLVFISSRHDSHSALAMRALESGKCVFLEKPMAIRFDEFCDLVYTHRRFGGERAWLHVGFNRRYSQAIVDARKRLSGTPALIDYAVNAGRLPASHWTRDPEVGGGRILGEVCHFVDTLAFLVGAPPKSIAAFALPHEAEAASDSIAATIEFGNGTCATLRYSAEGAPGIPKERITMDALGSTTVIENFRQTTTYPTRGKPQTIRGKQDKGHAAQFRDVVTSFKKRTGAPVPVESFVDTTLATFAIQEAVYTREVQQLAAWHARMEEAIATR